MKKSPKKTVAPISPLDLKQTAAAFYAEKNYKKALEYYKTLLKQQPNEENQAIVSDCYIKRTQQLVQKGMYQEALVLWENHSGHCPSCTHFYQYLNLLLAVGSEHKAAAVFVQNKHRLSEEQVLIIEEIFAALLVGKKDAKQLANAFPAESLLLRDLVYVNEALAAYARQDIREVELILGQIPFRSPYKQFRQVLKSCLLLPVDKGAALAVLDRVPSASPFYHLAGTVRQSQAAPLELVKSLSGISQPSFNLLSGLKGWDSAQQKYLNKLRLLSNQSKPQLLFDLIINNLSLLDKLTARRLCYSLLPFYMPGVRAFEKSFSVLSVEEKAHLDALKSIYHLRSFPPEVWVKYEKALSACKPQTPVLKLKRALALRHAVDFARKEPGIMAEKSISSLKKSLKLDPLDKSTYQILINHYQEQGQQKLYQQWIDSASRIFPQDREIMLLSIEAATRDQSPEYIINLARKLLALDPLNKKAQQYLAEYQLQQAQDWQKAGDWQRAAASLAEIKAGIGAGFLQQKIDLNLALCEYSEKNYVRSRLLIQQYGEEDISVRTMLAIQADLLGISLSKLESKLKLIALNKLKLHDANQLLALTKTIEQDGDNSAIHWKEILKMIKKPLDVVLKRRLTEEELITLCRCFTKIKQFKSVSDFIKSQYHLRSSPLLVYYQINARAQGNPKRIKQSEYSELEDALDEAEEDNDSHAAKLINTLLMAVDGCNDFMHDENDGEIWSILEEIFEREVFGEKPPSPRPDKKKTEKSSKTKQTELF